MTKTERHVLNTFRSQPTQGRRDICEHLRQRGTPYSESAVARSLRALLAAHYLEHVGRGNTAYYKLTLSGRFVIELALDGTVARRNNH